MNALRVWHEFVKTVCTRMAFARLRQTQYACVRMCWHAYATKAYEFVLCCWEYEFILLLACVRQKPYELLWLCARLRQTKRMTSYMRWHAYGTNSMKP